MKKRAKVKLKCSNCGKIFYRRAGNDMYSKGYSAQYCPECYPTIKKRILDEGRKLANLRRKRKSLIKQRHFYIQLKDLIDELKKNASVSKVSSRYVKDRIKNPCFSLWTVNHLLKKFSKSLNIYLECDKDCYIIDLKKAGEKNDCKRPN